MKDHMIYLDRPVPMFRTPFFLRLFCRKKEWRYRRDGSWVYANDIHEVYKQLKELCDDDYL
jgi:hypothetical protein